VVSRAARRPETRLVRGKSGSRRIVVERGIIAVMPNNSGQAALLIGPLHVKAIPVASPSPNARMVGQPTAVDCENKLRGRQHFPREFYEEVV
jgi:hypothetical protein